MHRIRVTAETGAYPVVVGCGAWKQLRALIADGYSSVFVLTEKRIWSRWAEDFSREGGLETARVVFVPSGEESKSLAQAERVAGTLLRQGADRKSLLVLFGGGVIGDLGGFVASTYMRGIDCVQVPTTVVGQVDSAVGGKTAVNVGAMKNLVGTFYPPRAVLADPRVLGSLGPRIFRSGLYEVAKHAILDGPALFKELERNLDSLAPENAADLAGIIGKAVKVKVDVVNRDERESSLRQVLNLGHTFGHALEEVTGYRRFLHGEAVGWGLLAVALLAERLGYLGSQTGRDADALTGKAGMSFRISEWDSETHETHKDCDKLLLADQHSAFDARVDPGASLNESHERFRRTAHPPQGPGGASDAERIRRLVMRIGPLPSIRDVSPQAITRLLPHDKKAVGGEIRWIIPERIGRVRIITGVPLAEAEGAWKELQRRANHHRQRAESRMEGKG
jgi:3-dehydroquinate synthase